MATFDTRQDVTLRRDLGTGKFGISVKFSGIQWLLGGVLGGVAP